MSKSDDDGILSFVTVEQNQLREAVKRAKERDFAAFELLYHAYKKNVWERLVYIIGNREAVKDIFQETFVRAWIHLPATNDDVVFDAWLLRIAANLAIDYLRHEKRITFLPLPQTEAEESSWDQKYSTADSQQRLSEQECIEQALAQLPPKHRICLLLQDHWGYSQREIAQLLNINEKRVSTYVSRGRRQFREAYARLSGEFVEHGNEGAMQ
ncbi:MAG TPA: RNA polymerase sigma factor [Ktedonobacteraceae bacterium]|nr:RNA polymerase sigma factor [Ktedonobacteraceae bacterium]